MGFCAGLAVLAFGIEMDRQSRTSPALAASVPAPLRAFADAQLAASALAAGDHAAALAASRELIRRMPLPAENLSLFARAAAANGQGEAADRAVMLAAGRGWRDPFVQVVMMRTALASGQPAIAADRLIAFVAAHDGGDGFDQVLLDEVLHEPAAAEAFGRRLASMPGLPDRFMNAGATSLPASEYARTMAAIWKFGGRVDCAPVSVSARNMFIHGDADAALRLWIGTCGAADRGKVASLDFHAPSGNGLLTPFDWEFPEHPDLTTNLRHESGRFVLDYRSRNPGILPVAVKYVSLPAGVRAIGLAGNSGATGPVARIVCLKPGGGGPALRTDLSQGPATIVVDRNCPVQRVELAVVGAADRRSVSLQVR